MTPAVQLLKRERVSHRIHEYAHAAGCAAYGREAAEKLGLDECRVFKTLVVSLDESQLAVAVVPVASMLHLKHLARAAGARKVAMADKSKVERVTGYVLGGVSPLAQKKPLKTFIDASARDFPTIYVSGGRRGLQVELAPEDLARLTEGVFVPLCLDDGTTGPL